jgi:hypothetical protein
MVSSLLEEDKQQGRKKLITSSFWYNIIFCTLNALSVCFILITLRIGVYFAG